MFMSLTLIILVGLFLPAIVSAQETAPVTGGLLWLEQMAAYFEEHPELKDQKSSGWKPYNRAKWLRERRLTDGTITAGEAQWHVWEEKERRSASSTKSARSSWFPVGPVNISGRMLDIEFDPTNTDIIYAGSASGGLWKTTDGGDTWVTTTDDLPTLAVGAVCVLPSNPDIVLIGTGEGSISGAGGDGVGILRSIDAGQTWNLTDFSFPLPSGHGFLVMKVCPLTGTILAGANDGLYRSTDDGQTWTQEQSNGYFYDIQFKPDDPSVIYTCKGQGLARNNVKISTDDGITWAKLGTGQPESNLVGKTMIAVCAADPDVIYANYVNVITHQTLGIYRSDDAGANWYETYSEPNMTGSQGYYNLTLTVDPDDPEIVIAGGVQLYRSTDGGVNYDITGDGYGLGTSTSVHWDHHDMIYEPGSTNTVWAATDGGIWKSDDDGVTWSSRREGLATYQFYDICVAQSDPSFAMGGTQDNGVTGRVTGEEWFTSTLFADGFVCNIRPGNADGVYAESQFGNHVKSTDGGQTWGGANNGITGSGRWLTPVAMDINDPKQLFTSTTDGIFRTDNRMSNWTNITSYSAIWIDVSLADGDVIWIVNSGGSYVSIDDGDTWTLSSSYGFDTGPETKVTAHPTDAGTAFITFGSYNENAKIAMTTDYGLTWTDVTGDLPMHPVNTMVIDPDAPYAWYIGTDMGVWTSINGGANWTPFDTGLPNAFISDLEIRRDTRKLAAGTYGRGMWESDLAAISTGVQTAGSVGSSLNLMLDPPFPNPVADKTVFRFAARHDGPVSLDIYDVRGRLVDHLADASHGDGYIRNITWSADQLSSGVYFLRLSAGNQAKVRRVVITK